jgi:preprotein translocase subunit Sec63
LKELIYSARAKNCGCDICKDRYSKRAAYYKWAFLDKWFIINFCWIMSLWYVCYICFDVIKDLEPLKSFTPHEILGVEMDATKAQVKKAYRRLSRDKHPDKNPDNPQAVNEFIQITKAYTIMTDDKARDNHIKHSNPDGAGSFAVGIALPTFIQKAEFQVQVLVAFFIIVVFLIPGYFMQQIEKNQKDIGGVELETRKIFSECID